MNVLHTIVVKMQLLTYLDQNVFGPIVLLFNDRSFSVQPPANKTEDRTNAKKAFISTIKSKVESTTGLKLLPVYDEEKKHKTRGLILANQMDRSEDSSNLTGAKYLGFFSSRSLKTREKCISFGQLVKKT